MSGAVRVSVATVAQAAPEPIVVDRGSAAHAVDGSPTTATLDRLDAERALLRERPDGPTHRVLLVPLEAGASRPAPGVERREVVLDGWRVEVDIEQAARAGLRDRARRGREAVGASGPTKVHAIIPGVVVAVSVAAGDG